MKVHIPIGTVAARVLVVSCAAEPEEVAPTTVAEDVATEAAEPAASADNETDAIAPRDGYQEVLDAGASATTSSTQPGAPVDAAVEAEDGGSTETTAPAPGTTEPTVPAATVSELPETGVRGSIHGPRI